MTDIVNPATRSRLMSGIRGKDTKPELVVRRGLFALGFRYRLHSRSLPGHPDLTFAGRRAVVFVHGCFWHGHDCALFRWPSTNVAFWRAKIERNREVDERSQRLLEEAGWRVLSIWECALKGRKRLPLDTVLRKSARWLKSAPSSAEIRGLVG